MAEQTGRIHDLDAWVLQSALEWMDRNPDGIASLSGLSVNLSGSSLVRAEHVESMLNLLGSYPHLTRKLILEVTETAAIGNMESAVRALRKLRKLGCRVALDDFGSGYSSYGYLRRLPLDYLKIDGIYVRNLLTDKTDQALTASMVDVAHALGLKVIAEYVDNEATYDWLKQLGVDYVQGYWVHEPERLDVLGAG
jgi:EAL domain-containing protein (putative c-di-GMP-specific phosphodiesterase class I)